jgi:hypothetical protein
MPITSIKEPVAGAIAVAQNLSTIDLLRESQEVKASSKM